MAQSRNSVLFEKAPSWPVESVLRLLIIALIAIGVLTRLSPLLDVEGRAYWQFVTEDGYLMQTVARNMAIGLSMSTAEGTIPTNGVQPLATFFFAGLHWIAGGDKLLAVILVHWFSLAASILAALALYGVAMAALDYDGARRSIAGVIAAAWFASPLVVAHSMNALETSVYYAVLLSVLYLFLARTGGVMRIGSLGMLTVFGALLGLAFLARVDAAFFIAAFLFHYWIADGVSLAALRARLGDCLIMGILSIAVASPWLIYNYSLFGTIVPISGLAQSHSASFASNIAAAPAILFETIYVFPLVPEALEKTPAGQIVSALFIIGFLGLIAAAWRGLSAAARRLAAISLLFGAILCSYYALWFGAEHFLSRYFSILSPLFWTLLVLSGLTAAARLKGGAIAAARPPLFAAGTLAAAAVSAVFAVDHYAKGERHMHRQVVEWVQENAPSDAWVGAVQTGTLGYFHDRTINLDGKVNPDALRAILEEGHVFTYVAGSEIDYLADWYGLAGWARLSEGTAFGERFELVKSDRAANLAAFKRRGAD